MFAFLKNDIFFYLNVIKSHLKYFILSPRYNLFFIFLPTQTKLKEELLARFSKILEPINPVYPKIIILIIFQNKLSLRVDQTLKVLIYKVLPVLRGWGCLAKSVFEIH